MKKILIYVFALALNWNGILAQGLIDGNVASPIPPSPDAASLGKYGNVPVNLSAGQPNISIPVFTINEGSKLSFPVSLSYNASGVKVNEIASWVGANWTLNYGGVINRQVRGGFPDEMVLNSTGYYDKPSLYTNAHKMGEFDAPLNTGTTGGWVISTEDRIYIESLANGVYDTEPDLYSFNFPGGSGSFIIGRDSLGNFTSVVLIPEQRIKVDVANYPSSFTLTNEEGIKYVFDEIVTTRKMGNNIISPYIYNSSWFLKEIISPINSTQKITYTYETAQLRYLHNFDISQTFSLAGSAPSVIVQSKDSIEYLSRRLTSMVSNNNSIIFYTNAANERLDFNNDYPLDSIEIFDRFGKLVRTKVFNYSYYGGTTKNNYRLRLDSFYEKINSSSLPSHKFEYNTLDPPAYNSNSQDFWGYYNGKSNNTLIPNLRIYHSRIPVIKFEVNDSTTLTNYIDPGKAPYPEPFGMVAQFSTGGGDREVDTLFSQAGILKKITYPTGGYTLFEYENNIINPTLGNRLNLIDQFDQVLGKVVNLYNVDTSIDVTLDSRLWGIKYDYYEHFFGKYHEVKDSIFQLITFSGDGGFQYAEKTIYITTKQTVSIMGEINGRLGPPVIAGEIKKVGIEGINGTVYFKEQTQSGYPQQPDSSVTFSLTDKLEVGWYRFYVQANTTDEFDKMVKLTVDFGFDLGIPPKKVIGGLRIKRISDYAGSSAIPTIKKYIYEEDGKTAQKSSGMLMNLAEFSYLKYQEGISSSSSNVPELVVTAQPNSGASGSYNSAYYTSVIVLEDENGENGKTEYTFLEPYDDLLLYDNDPGAMPLRPEYYPFPFGTGYSWLQGQITSKKMYKAETTGEFTLLSEELNEYDKQYVISDIKGYKYAYFGPHVINELPDTKWKRFTMDYTNGYLYPKRTESIFYGIDTLHTITDFTYENQAHMKLSLKTSYLNNGLIHKTRYYYPLDSLHLPDASGLINAHIIGTPIEVINWQEMGGGKSILSANRGLYFNNLLIDKAQLLENTNPVPFTNDSLILGSVDLLYKDILSIDSYDNQGNIRSFTKRGSTTTYIWGYNLSYPVAKLENATYSDIQAYEANIQALSNADNDHCLEGEGCTEDALRTALQDLKDKPNLQNAIITTYTYDLLVGITSQSDSNNKTTYYEYDDFGRLQYVIDDNGNVLKKYKYKYKQN